MEVSRLIFSPLTILVSKVSNSIKNISHLDLVIKKILMLRLNFGHVSCVYMFYCVKSAKSSSLRADSKSVWQTSSSPSTLTRSVLQSLFHLSHCYPVIIGFDFIKCVSLFSGTP